MQLPVRHIFLIAIAAVSVILDQLSKWFMTEIILKNSQGNSASLGFIEWMLEAPERLGFMRIEVTNFYNIVMVWNEGISFGLLNAMEQYGPLILVALSALISVFLLVWMLRTSNMFQATCLAMVIGGALGNIIDRLRFGAVIDFIDLHLMGYHWPAFNIADSCVVVGILLLIFHSLFLDTKTT